ncbi:aldehyde dehydrogenase [Nitratireductor aestuarii]|uniref:Aldehyde dehydrogenase n=1 Tax=Nitratireductor aestuarii TaxID=1735103 RepID=A0A916RUK7_9HYPH|nr:molybdopterin cofactor-binding domain-containing protein [Nitratireductor aestuarii]GGA66937.1 aldehyde dehydrogenase [Nitratireductor aestuarii]
MNQILISRRSILRGGGALVVSFAMPSVASAASAESLSPAGKSLSGEAVDGFLSIGTDGIVTVYSGKVDLGTGVPTALAQMVAEELDLTLDQIHMITGDTALTPDQGTTSGSNSIMKGGMQLCAAAATARNALLKMAGEKLGVAADELTIEAGVIKPSSGGEGIGFGELVGGKTFELAIDPDAKFKSPDTYKLVGKSIKRFDIPGKVTGTFDYIGDVRVDGMVHARVIRPAAIHADLVSVNEDSVKDIPGLIKVVREGNFLAVVAKTEWAAVKAADALEVEWSDWKGLPDQSKIYDYVRNSEIDKTDVVATAGDAAGALANAKKTLEATYSFPIHSHASLGPSCAVADFKDGKLTCWSPSQGNHALQKQLAEMLQLDAQNIRIVYVEGAGCYGRNGFEDCTADAALLSKLLEVPVRVQWMRHDEHGWDPKGPPSLADLKGAIDDDGKIVAWDSQFYHAQSVGNAVTLVAADLAKLSHQPGGRAGSVQGNADLGYKLPNVQTSVHWVKNTPFRASWIRTPGRLQNTFANECFIDELAAEAKVDPFDLRLSMLEDPRGREVMERLRKLSNWETRPSPASNQEGNIARGRGVAYCHYHNTFAYVAAVCEVEVNRESGEIKATRFYVTHDLGQVINPDGLINQVEGNVCHTLSRTLHEELQFDNSSITSLDWVSYPVLTMTGAPEIIVELIDRPEEPPMGGGEPSAAIVTAAVGNAIFDATGVRLRQVPFTPERFKAAAMD